MFYGRLLKVKKTLIIFARKHAWHAHRDTVLIMSACPSVCPPVTSWYVTKRVNCRQTYVKHIHTLGITLVL